MLNSALVKNVLALLLLVAVAYLSFRYVTRPMEEVETPGVTVTSSDFSDPSAENLANVFAVLLEKLSTVDFQKSNPIFNNPIFQNGLISFSRELPEIDKTRPNPFAPIEGNPALYVRYPAPVVAPLNLSTSTDVFPVGDTATKATTTTR